MSKLVYKRKNGQYEARFWRGRDKNGRIKYGSVVGATEEEAIERRRLLGYDPQQGAPCSEMNILILGAGSYCREAKQLGFFHESYIGNKEGDGRTWLYVLNRGLAPIFHLDPTGFTGYLFMTNDDLRKAIQTGKRLRKVTDEKGLDTSGQMTFEDYWENNYGSQRNK